MKRIPGVVVGIVRDVNDPHGLGRICVDFPWMEGAQRSGWAPMATPLTGPNRGMYFFPELNDEVLLAFDHGDFNTPFIVGCLWNGGARPPETHTGKRLLVTPGGHRLLFDDDDPKKVQLTANSGHSILLDEQTITIQINGGASTVTLRSDSITLQGGGRSVAMSGGKVQIR